MKYLFIIFCFGFVACQSGRETQATLLSPQEFSDYIRKDQEVVILDVRTPAEVQNGMIPNAVNLDFNNKNFQQGLDELDKSKKYLVYCASGKRSGKAQQMMSEMGFENVSALDGGINAWISSGLPVTAKH
jgi:rhodanese-related sulfurtransferase